MIQFDLHVSIVVRLLDKKEIEYVRVFSFMQ